jgi:alkanesulfonate monooxygenase SsuD/methylene tetrahydromethanopterin reductase-like flavin-dependent oxidoreductase (luciferase family)
MDEQDEFFVEKGPFEVPLPPPGPGPHDRVMWIRGEPEAGAREHEDIMLRRVPRETAMHFRAAAGGRSLTHAQYLTALVELHRRTRERADDGDEELKRALDDLGLGSVTV